MYDHLFSQALLLLKSTSLAEEATQDTFCVACRKVQSLLESENPQGWLMITHINNIRAVKREMEKTKSLLARQFRMSRDNLWQSQEPLPLELLYGNVAHTEEFQLFTERAVEGHSYCEMAKNHGISESACRKKIERARKFLQKKLKFLSQT